MIEDGIVVAKDTAASPNSTQPDAVNPLMVWLAMAASFAGALAVNLWVGLIVFMGDSYLLADRAKHLILAGNLNLNNEYAGLVYPPLYPILISPAYLSHSPETSFQIILALHSLLVACQVWPFYKLLTEYARVPEKFAPWFAVALSLAPFTLPYASMMLTEVAFIPLLLWMTYFVLRWQENAGVADAVRAGCFLGLMLLVRSAATTILLAFVGAALLTAWQFRRDSALLRQRAMGLACFLLAFGVVFGTWKLYEKFFVLYGARAGYFTADDIRIIFSEKKRFDHHFSWFTNTFFYYLTAPLSIAGCFFYSIAFQRLRRLLRDPLFPFAVLSLVISALTVVLVMTQGWGGRELTWNKYIAPYVFFIVLVAVRYRSWFNRSQLRASALVLSLVFLAFKPSGLGCHFTDALVLFTSNTNPMQIPETVANAIFLLVILLPAWLWLRGTEGMRRAAVAVTGIVWLSSLYGAANVYRHGGDLNISNYGGAAKEALAIVRQAPGTAVYFDPESTAKDSFGALRLLFYWPVTIQPIKADQIATVASRSPLPVLYFTDKELSGLQPLKEDRGVVKLYSFTAASPGATATTPAALPSAGTKLQATLGSDVSGAEVTEWKGQKYSVRWLRRATAFTIENPGGEFTGTVRMQLGVANSHQNIQLTANGTVASETPLVQNVFWGHGPQVVAFRVSLKPGRNAFTLSSLSKPDALPGGREVHLLLIGEIAATPQ